VDELKDDVQAEHQGRFEGFPLTGVQAIEFFPLSKHVLITKSSEGILKISVCALEDGECVHTFFSVEDRSGQKERKLILHQRLQ